MPHHNCPPFLWKAGRDFHDTGARFPTKASSGNWCPIWRAPVESSLAPFGRELGSLPTRPINFAGTAIHLRLLHGHPKSKIQTAIQSGLDFGSGILDCRSIRSFCGSPKRGRLEFGSWISEFGFCERFGFCIRLLLLHADSSRRIIDIE